MMNGKHLALSGIAGKTAVVHTVTYFTVGAIAFSLFNYSAGFAQPPLSSFMRPTTEPLVRMGVVFQPIRGALFGLVFYLLQDVLFQRGNGWLVMWVTLVVVGILSTFGPAPGSIEGLIYTKIPFDNKVGLGGLAEILSQSFLLSVITYYWVNHPEKRWLTWLLAVLFAVVLILPALGLLANRAGS
jgi:hypothetical protein